jgi:hypothetical protein
MGKKVKGSVLDDYEKLKNEIIRDKVDEIFRKHPKDYIAKMEELGFEYFEDDDDDEIEERNAQPENQRQRDLVAYFEGKKKLSKKILESYFEEKAAENPNYPLIRSGEGIKESYDGQPQRAAPTAQNVAQPQGIAPTVGDVVGAFKSLTTNDYIRNVKQNNWQPLKKIELYHDGYPVSMKKR